jgi:hypothetical protein
MMLFIRRAHALDADQRTIVSIRGAPSASVRTGAVTTSESRRRRRRVSTRATSTLVDHMASANGLSTFHVKRRRRVPLAERVRALDELAKRASGLARSTAHRTRQATRVVELVTAALATEATQ